MTKKNKIVIVLSGLLIAMFVNIPVPFLMAIFILFLDQNIQSGFDEIRVRMAKKLFVYSLLYYVIAYIGIIVLSISVVSTDTLLVTALIAYTYHVPPVLYAIFIVLYGENKIKYKLLLGVTILIIGSLTSYVTIKYVDVETFLRQDFYFFKYTFSIIKEIDYILKFFH